MIGLVIAGPWLTTAMARWCARVLGGRASGLLASRRLADDPKAAFRAVRGLVLAVFLGTIVGALVPLLDSLIATPNSAALSNVLLDNFFQIEPPTLPAAGISGITPVGLTPQAGTVLVSGLQGLGGTTVYPLYTGARRLSRQSNYIGVVSCSALCQLAVLGQRAWRAGGAGRRIPLRLQRQPARQYGRVRLRRQPALHRVPGQLAGPVRRCGWITPAPWSGSGPTLAIHAPPQVSAGQGVAATPPRTYGEAVAIRSGRAEVMQRLVYFAVTLTILVAAVASRGVDRRRVWSNRKRPFTMLRVGGTPLGTLYRVVLLEALLPLVGGAVAAAALAYGMSVLAVLRIAPAGTPVPPLAGTYYATIGVGLGLALAVIAITLPLLGRMTTPASARFE